MTTPFIINLTKTNQGFIYHSLEDTHSQNKNKKYKPPPPTKPFHNKITNRLIKEIEQITDKPYHIEQNHPVKEPLYHFEQPIRVQIQITQEEEDIDCEIKRNQKTPICPAEWFNIKIVHDIEINHFPEFYSLKCYKTPELYQSYRNFIVQAYLKNTKRYLTFVACRRVLRGDVNTLLKIYKFLEYHGIINYCIFIEGNFTFKTPCEDKISDLSIIPQTCIKKLPETSQTQTNQELDTDNLTVTVINKNFSRTFRVYCSKCKLICGIVWFTSSLHDESQRNICFQCYNSLDTQSKPAFFKTDILKKMQLSKENKHTNKTSWGLQDNIKLLQFMGNSEGKEWDQIMAQFDGKKSLQDIIIQFMQFPITNFDPQKLFQSLKPEQIDYKQQQHVQMLYRLYQQSNYAIKAEQKLQQEQKTNGNINNFRTYSNKILQKYVNKISKLQTLQNILQQTNLSINQQLLCNRIKINKDVQQNSSQMKEESEHKDYDQ